MLEPQLLKTRLPKITPTIKVPGVDVQIQALDSQIGNILTGRLLRVVESLKKADQLKQLDQLSELRNGIFYQDQNTWHSGLFSFKGSESLHAGPLRAVSYLLWRSWNDSIILLAGSPLNILGERNVRDGLWAGGTSGTWQVMLEFASSCLRSDEEALVAVGTERKHSGHESVKWADLNSASFDESDEYMPMEMSQTADALTIATLCVRFLSRLPRSRVETAFTVFNELEMKRRVSLPAWTRTLLETPALDPNLRNVLMKCKKVYIGSPLYTAIG